MVFDWWKADPRLSSKITSHRCLVPLCKSLCRRSLMSPRNLAWSNHEHQPSQHFGSTKSLQKCLSCGPPRAKTTIRRSPFLEQNLSNFTGAWFFRGFQYQFKQAKHILAFFLQGHENTPPIFVFFGQCKKQTKTNKSSCLPCCFTWPCWRWQPGRRPVRRKAVDCRTCAAWGGDRRRAATPREPERREETRRWGDLERRS